jgi:hypothetical protein
MSLGVYIFSKAPLTRAKAHPTFEKIYIPQAFYHCLGEKNSPEVIIPFLVIFQNSYEKV